jgi:hypothetical protein
MMLLLVALVVLFVFISNPTSNQHHLLSSC